MIVPMKKVSVVVLNSERKESLKKLRRIGLIHLEEVEGKGPVLAAYKEASANADKAISILDEIKLPKKHMKDGVDLSGNEAEVKAKEIVALGERKKALLEVLRQNNQELERLNKWGSVDPQDFVNLAEKGIFMYMYEIPVDKYSLIGDKTRTLMVNSVGKIARFLLLSDGEVLDRPEDFPPEAFSVPMPDKSTDQLLAENKAADDEISQIELTLLDSKKYRDSIDEFRQKLASDIEFETVFSGMEREGVSEDPSKTTEMETVEQALAAIEEEEKQKDAKLAWLTGYVPEDSMEDFAIECKRNEWAFASSDPADDDPVPTKLQNNKFVSMIYPLTDFLGTVPGYHEFDISGWFLMFFTVFFAMIFGDGGYGLLVTAVMLLMMLKSKVSKKKVSPVFGLILLVSLATVVWGAVTCTWFGIPMDKLPDWLKNLSIPVISNAYEDKLWNVPWISDPSIGLTKDQNIQIFCFSLALIQLSVAHIKAAVRNVKEGKGLKVLGDLGSLLQLIGMFWIVLSMVVNDKVFQMLGNIGSVPVGKIAVSLIAIGFAMSFIFANYEGSVGKSILESCKNIISVLLGVVNVFSDIVSYIRLWAVGLAGAAISSTVNTLAGPILGHAILFFLAVILLVFGHGLNMILNVLSVIVHGVRLNTLEFCTHVGMSWSGVKYRPFADKDLNK